AMTLNNLANAYLDQAQVLHGEERIQALQSAADAMEGSLDVWTLEAAPEMYEPRVNWIAEREREMEAARASLAAVEDPSSITDWSFAFRIGRELSKQGDLAAAAILETRGKELAESAGVALNPHLGIWNGASLNEINAYAWGLIDPERPNRETDVTLGLNLARAICEQRPLESAFQDTLAWAYFANGLHEEAIATSEHALDLAPAQEKANYEGY
ncbi:MAG: hypothetical protein KDB61_16605, partial [Planctomycetes bacterium]|nr:hypothetical protein [Planctomycetota bacterium]